jgi:hypothetical protein
VGWLILRYYCLRIINPGENIDSNLSDFVTCHHCIFWVTRFYEGFPLRIGEIRTDFIVRECGRGAALFDGNRTLKLAFCAGWRRYCLYDQVNSPATALSAPDTQVVAGIFRFKTKLVTRAK